MQLMRIFFDAKNRNGLPSPPADHEIRTFLSQNNSRCPLNQIIVSDDNEGNMRILRDFAYTALTRPNRSLRGCNFGIYSGSGQGKTFVAKQFAKTIGIPFVFVQASSLNDTYDLFLQIKAAFEDHVIESDDFYDAGKRGSKLSPIVEWKNPKDNSDYTIPPCIILLDEAHSVKRKLMQGGLLNAMERDDGMMAMRGPGVSAEHQVVNMRNVCWIAATTERGMLFDAFENRLGTAIEWHHAGEEEITKIIKMKMNADFKNGELPFALDNEAATIVSKMMSVPREAINFASKVILRKSMFPSYSWIEVARGIAEDMGLDEWGFSRKQVDILTALGQRPIAESRLPAVAKCRIEQVQRFEMPKLMSYDNGGPLVVSIAGKGMCITEKGLGELDKRGIDHRGYKVTAEHFEDKR